MPDPPPRIIIVGCGFGGLFAARALAHASAEVLIIDRNNYHFFQPFLYQVASAALASDNIAQPIRMMLRKQRNAVVLLGEVERISLAEHRVFLGESPIDYEYLILAPGTVDNYFGHEEWRDYAPGMKALEAAIRIRARLLLAFEAAEMEADPSEREAQLTFAIIGGGSTGVELAGAIKELAVDVVPRDFRSANTRRARVVLIEGGPRLLPGLHADSSARALRQLESLGVEVILGRRVTSVHADGLEMGEEHLRSHNVIWCAGVHAAPLVSGLGVELGPGGRVKVAPDCSIPNYPNAFVIGDAAYLEQPDGHAVPGVSQGAMQMGRFVARIILAELEGSGEARQHRFHYRDYGAMSTIGKSRAVVEIGPLHYGGWLAWLTWLGLHITVLIGFRNRLAVLTSWMYSYLLQRRGSRLITGARIEPVKRLEPPHVSLTSGAQPPPQKAGHGGTRA
jgi:NADH:ubiquinone reductase (H+-translocating)